MNLKRCGACGIVTNEECCQALLEVPSFAKVEERSDYQTMSDKITKHHDSTVERRKEALTIVDNSKGTKHDNGKADLTLIPREAMEAMARAFMYGEKKYSRGNFKQGIESTRTLAAALRHIYEKLDRVDLDPESGVDTLGHAMAAIAMTIYNLKHHPEMDNRDKKGEK